MCAVGKKAKRGADSRLSSYLLARLHPPQHSLQRAVQWERYLRPKLHYSECLPLETIFVKTTLLIGTGKSLSDAFVYFKLTQLIIFKLPEINKIKWINNSTERVDIAVQSVYCKYLCFSVGQIPCNYPPVTSAAPISPTNHQKVPWTEFPASTVQYCNHWTTTEDTRSLHCSKFANPQPNP